MNMMRYFLLITLLGLSCTLFAADNNIIFEKANELYHNKHYDSAATLYQQMIEDGYRHPDLYYNAGNAYYRSHKTGLAVWCFNKALQLSDQKNYRDNLLLAQKKIEQPIASEPDIFFLRWWHSLRDAFSVNQWAILALAFFLLSMLLLIARNIFQKNIGSAGLTRLLMFCTFFCLLLLGTRYYHDVYHYHGIIIKPNTAFTAESKSSSATLSEGIEVEFISRDGGRLKVRLPDGRTGLINGAAFKRL